MKRSLILSNVFYGLGCLCTALAYIVRPLVLGPPGPQGPQGPRGMRAEQTTTFTRSERPATPTV